MESIEPGPIDREGEVRATLPPRPELPHFGARELDPRFQGIAASRGFRQNNSKGDGSYHDKYYRPERLKYSHEAMADYILANPTASIVKISEVFDVTPGWTGRIINSDAFQAFLAARRSEVTDPILAHEIEDQLKGMVAQSVEVLTDKLEKTRNPDLALKALEIGSKALGFGARDRGPVVNNSFVVALPPQAPDAKSWAEAHAPKPVTIDAKPVERLGTLSSFDPLSQPKPMTPIEE